jgi:hypothetical protein
MIKTNAWNLIRIYETNKMIFAIIFMIILMKKRKFIFCFIQSTWSLFIYIFVNVFINWKSALISNVVLISLMHIIVYKLLILSKIIIQTKQKWGFCCKFLKHDEILLIRIEVYMFKKKYYITNSAINDQSIGLSKINKISFLNWLK